MKSKKYIFAEITQILNVLIGILPAANQRLSMTEIEIDSQEDTKKPRKWSQVWHTHSRYTVNICRQGVGIE